MIKENLKEEAGGILNITFYSLIHFMQYSYT